MQHRRTLIGLMVFLFLFWFVLPNLIPGSASIIFLITLPVRDLGVFVHEMGHGLGTLVSGGRFLWFEMDLINGGVATTAGGLRFVSLLGGLLGPAIGGAFLLIASSRARFSRGALVALALFFCIGAYYMVKPLFLSSSDYAMLDQWSASSLISLVIPITGIWATLRVLRSSSGNQRFFLQVLGVCLCFAAFSDTHYIFYFDRLPNQLFSDTRVLAATFWPSVESLPYLLFLFTAVLVSGLNFSLLYWGFRKSLQGSEKAAEQKIENKVK